MDAEFNGFVVIDRKILEWEWYKDIKVYKLFTHLIFKANFKENSWRGHFIKRGQLITGLFSLSDETGMSVKEVRTALKKLISTEEIIVEATNKFSKITVVNYDKYQSQTETRANERQSKGNQKTNKGQQLNNDNNDNNDNNIEVANKAKELGLLKSQGQVNESHETDRDIDIEYYNFGESITQVKIKKEELDKLQLKMSKEEAWEYIQDLEAYIIAKGDKYKSHYGAILSWHRRDIKEGKIRIRTEE